jgi:hypothetical protein
MIDPDSPPHPAVDRCIAEYLQRAAQQTDAAGLLQRVRRSRQVDEAIFPTASFQLTTLTWPLLAVAILLATFVGGHQWGARPAGAAGVLRDLQSVHLREVDRCYRVQYAPDPRFWDGTNQLEGPSHSVLWTRGDRFWSDCTIGELNLRIGRQQDGTLWVSRSKKHGIRFSTDPAHLPQEVALLCAVNSLTVPRLVEEVLSDFDLRMEQPLPRADATGMLVWATPKPERSHPLIASALLEIDPQSHALTRLVLWMLRDGRPRGTVTYTYLESGIQTDASYQLETHLDDDAEIEGQSFEQSEKRS